MAAWFVPIPVERLRIVATGFADFFGAEGRLPAEIIGDAQFLLDIGEAVGTQPRVDSSSALNCIINVHSRANSCLRPS